MRTLSPLAFLKTAERTARHFGFSPVSELPPVENEAKSRMALAAALSGYERDVAEDMLLRTAGACLASGERQPRFIFSLHAGTGRSATPQDGAALALAVVGVQKSIAEALLIQTLRALFSDFGYQHTVRVNCLGDRDSLARYGRELAVYLKRRLESMPPRARELMREDALTAFFHLVETGHELCAHSPNPLECLSDYSRRHFREIIEYLEMTEMSYEIDPRLLGGGLWRADTLFAFELRDAADAPLENPPIRARGGRLDASIRHLFNDEAPAAGALVLLRGEAGQQRRRAPAASGAWGVAPAPPRKRGGAGAIALSRATRLCAENTSARAS